MTIHEPGSPTHAWLCGRCGARRAGYPCASAAARAETRHTINRCTPAPDASVTR